MRITVMPKRSGTADKLFAIIDGCLKLLFGGGGKAGKKFDFHLTVL